MEETLAYNYLIDGLKLEILLNPKKNKARVFLGGNQLALLEGYQELSQGKTIAINHSHLLFLKLINLTEGFTIMLNNHHIIGSAGHPKTLMQKLNPFFLLGISSVGFQLLYTFIDIYQKGELQTGSLQPITYLFYHILITLILIWSFRLARGGNWKGASLGSMTLLLNLLFSVSLGMFFNTGINYFMSLIFFGHGLALLILLPHVKVVRYVRSYTMEQKKPCTMC